MTPVFGVVLAAIGCGLFCPATARAQLVEMSSNLFSQGSGFPEDWYLADAEELKDLRSLEGKPAPEISIAQWRGESTSLEQLKGKIVVLDFWATWCGPCMAAIPKNVALIDKLSDRGVAMIGLHDAKSGWDSVDKVISEKGINYPVALDETEGNSGATTAKYKLMFWPTYVVIDRSGTVRAIGLKPDKVESVVERLLEEAPVGGQAVQLVSTLPAGWYLGRDKRLSSMRAAEGESAPGLSIAQWVNTPPDRDKWKGQIKVVQFVRPELNVSLVQVAKLQAVAERFAKQGVAFMAVCDSRSNPDRVQAMIDDNLIDFPVALDRETEEFSIGASADALGIKFAPNTVVLDRRGVVRAAGLKPDFLDKVLNSLLSEPMPPADELVDNWPSDEPVADVATSVEAAMDEAAEVATAVNEEPVVEGPIDEEPVGEEPVVKEISQQAELPEDAPPPSPAAKP